MSSNNQQEVQRKMADQRQRFALRKYSIGLASVLIGLTFMGGITAHADTQSQPKTVNNENVAQTAEPVTTNNKQVVLNNDQANKQSSQQQATTGMTANNEAQATTDVQKGAVDQNSEVNVQSTDNNQKTTKTTTQITDKSAAKKNAEQETNQAQLPLVNLSVNAQSKYNVNDWQYTTSTDGITLTGYTGQGTDYYIPNAKAFRDAGKITAGQKVFLTYDFIQTLVNTNKATSISIERAADADDKVVAVGYADGSAQQFNSAFGAHTSNDNNDAGADGGNQTLKSLDLAGLDVSNITDMSTLFANDKALESVTGLDTWNFSPDMHSAGHMFAFYPNLKTIQGIDNWDTSNFKYVDNLVKGDTSLTKLDLSRWKTDNVILANSMFEGASALTTVGDLSGWRLNNATKTEKMFSGATKLNGLGKLDNWGLGKDTNMSGMFQGTSSLTSIGDIHGWDVSNVQQMLNMFNGTAISNFNISGWHFNSSMTTRYGTDDDDNPIYGSWGMFANLVNPTEIIANDLGGDVSKFSAADFYGNQPLIVISNSKDLQKMNNVNNPDNPEGEPGYDGAGGYGHEANTIRYVKLEDNWNASVRQQEDFVFASQEALDDCLRELATGAAYKAADAAAADKDISDDAVLPFLPTKKSTKPTDLDKIAGTYVFGYAIVYQFVDDENQHLIDDSAGYPITIKIKGNMGQTVDLSQLKLPAGYVLDDKIQDNTIPSGSYTFNQQELDKLISNGAFDLNAIGRDNVNKTIKIHLKHKTINVPSEEEPNPGDKIPGNKKKKPGDGTPNADVSYETLHRNMKRTITVNDPHSTTPSDQTVTISYIRNATIDDVTGDVTYSAWTPVDATKTGFKAFEIPAVAGYTSHISTGTADMLKEQTPTQDQITNWQDENVVIDYTANDQSMNINYVDDQGNKIATFKVSGKTDQVVDTNAKIPAGWVLVSGQTDAPATITFGGMPTADITVKIQHGMTNVPHTNPVKTDDKTPTGEDIKGAHKSDLNQTITRTINITEPGKSTNTITQTAKIYRDATYDNVTGDVTYGAWSTDGDDWTAVDIPVHAGYTVHQSDNKSGIPDVTVANGQADETINVTYTANDQSMNINYVDAQGNKIATFKVSGKTDQTVDTKATIPAGWVLSHGQSDAPKTVTFGGTPLADINIQIEHGMQNVPHTTPVEPGGKTPSGQPVKGAHDADLNQTIIRTINVTEPGQAMKTIMQTAKIYRDATVDEVTGDVTYTDWSTDATDWAEYDAPVHAGYTVSQAKVDAITVADGQKPVIVNITYTPNDQTGKIVYQDADNDDIEVGKTDLSGKTDEDVAIHPQAPAGFDIVSGQVIPATKKATATGIPTVTIKVQHHKITVRPDQEPKPGDKLPANPDKKPGDGTPKTEISYETLHRNMTRTINVTDPHTGLTTTKVTIHYERTATIDDVTGDVAYGNWTVADGSADGFDAFNIPAVAGYTSEIKTGTADELAALTPSQDQITNWADQTIDIDYTANDQSMTIDYVDKDGNPVNGGHFVVSGKTDQTVDTNAKIPTGWVLVSGQMDAPATITFTGTPTANITVKIEHGTISVPHTNPVRPGVKTPTGEEIKGAHESDLNQTITRTVTITEPGQAPKTTTQTAKIYRDATVDEVTGEVTYGAWSTDTTDWTAVEIPVHAGYTVHQSDGKSGVPAVTVKDGQKSETIDVTYTANDQTGKIVYVDVNNNSLEVGHTDLSGKTNATITITPEAPAGFDIVQGQNIPTSVKAGATGIPTVTVKVQHHKIVKTPNDQDLKNPGDKIPANPNKKPGDGTPGSAITHAGLVRDMTRTITVNAPANHGGTTTNNVTIHFTRNATIDDVTGEVSYSAWMPVDATKTGFDAFSIPKIDGYTPKFSAGTADMLKKQTLSQDQDQITNWWRDEYVVIDYTANDQSMNINYVDAQGNKIATFKVSGKTDQVVDTNAKIPAGWVLVPGQTDAPAKVTFGGTPLADINIQIEHGMQTVSHDKPIPSDGKTLSGQPVKGAHDADLNQTIIRTINVTEPGQATKTMTQTAKIYRDATVDEVTGDVTYTDWSTDATDWAEYDAPIHAGYTVSQAKVDPVTVKDGQKNVTVNITYSANDQTGKIVYVDVNNNNLEVGHTDLSGKTDATITITPAAPAGYDIVAGQNIPANEVATPTGIPTVTVKVSHHQITVTPGQEPKPGDKIPGNPDKKPMVRQRRKLVTKPCIGT